MRALAFSFLIGDVDGVAVPVPDVGEDRLVVQRQNAITRVALEATLGLKKEETRRSNPRQDKNYAQPSRHNHALFARQINLCNTWECNSDIKSQERHRVRQRVDRR